MKERLNTHHQLSTYLSLCSDSQLANLIERSVETTGQGNTHVLKFDGHKVFVKRIPLTNLELENQYSTRNIFRIPNYYSYGVGSAGFGAFRELAMQVKTTNWVRSGDIDTFPLMHHHRILPYSRTSKPTPQEQRKLKGYVAYWNNSQPIQNYMMARREANHQLVIFMEFLPYKFVSWINDNPGKLRTMFNKAIRNIDFLHSQDVIHFDAHVQNWMTDGNNLYLCDFGLALDDKFDLSMSERRFFKDHQYYDYAQVVSTIGDVVTSRYFQMTRDRRESLHKELGITPKDFYKFKHALSRDALRLHKKKFIRLPRNQKELLQQYKPVIDAKSDFLLKLRLNRRKNIKYPHQKLKRLLKKVEVI